MRRVTRTPMTRRFWQETGRLLVEEFCLVERTQGCGGGCVDALILPDIPARGWRRELACDGDRVAMRCRGYCKPGPRRPG